MSTIVSHSGETTRTEAIESNDDELAIACPQDGWKFRVRR